MPRLLTTPQTLRKDLFDDPRKSNHADYIGSSHTAHIATEDGPESICDHIQSGRCGDLRIPVAKVVVAELLCLWDVEYFVLNTRKDEILLLPAFKLGTDIRDMAPGRFDLLSVTTRIKAARAGYNCGRGRTP